MTTTKETLSREVAYVLDLPYVGGGGKAYKIVQAIFTVLMQALQSGQTIKVDGFGIFEMRTRAPTRCPVSYFYGIKSKHPHREIIDLPAKNMIIFKPTKPLLRELNKKESYVTSNSK